MRGMLNRCVAVLYYYIRLQSRRIHDGRGKVKEQRLHVETSYCDRLLPTGGRVVYVGQPSPFAAQQ